MGGAAALYPVHRGDDGGRHARADRASRFTAGFYSKDAIIEAAYASHRPGAAFAFLATVIAAGMTSFYSWRLVFMTFEGARAGAHAPTMPRDHEARARRPAATSSPPPRGPRHGHGDHTPHESPLTMLVPLGVLALGAIVAGFLFKGAFIGHDYDAFWKGALFTAKDNHILQEIHDVPAWVSLVAVRHDGARLPARAVVLHPRHAQARRSSRASSRCSTTSC